MPYHPLSHHLFFNPEHVLRPGVLLRRQKTITDFDKLYLPPDQSLCRCPKASVPLPSLSDDHCRVVLQPSDAGNGYINASYVDVGSEELLLWEG